MDNGLYCQRIASTLSGFDGVEVLEHRPGLGVPVDLEEVAREIRRVTPDWVAIVHHETTTGLLNPLAGIAGLCDETGARLFVDAVSSLGAHTLDPRADVVCFNSSKCLESLPGIAGVLWRSDLETHRSVPVLDVSAYSHGMASTPNVQAYVALDVALDLLAAEDRPARYERLARRVWARGGEHFDLLLDEPHRSHVLTSFRLGGRTIDELFGRAYCAAWSSTPARPSSTTRSSGSRTWAALMSDDTIDELFAILTT